MEHESCSISKILPKRVRSSIKKYVIVSRNIYEVILIEEKSKMSRTTTQKCMTEAGLEPAILEVA